LLWSRKKFRSCSEVEKGVLRSIKRLYYAGIYREREIFSTKIIKHLSKEKEEIEKKQDEWIKLLKELGSKGFIKIIKKAEVWAEEIYLEFVIEDDISVLNNLNEMMKIFSKDPEVLFRLGKYENRYQSL